MELIDIVRKLIGPVNPVGETHTDDCSFENLKVLVSLTEDLIDELTEISKNKDRQEFSMKRSGQYAFNYLKDIAEIQSEFIKDLS